jgi:hypothetical protein
MYDTIRMYEKEAARLKDKAAREKLHAAKTKYEEANMPSTAVKKGRKKKKTVENEAEELPHEDESDDADDSEEDDEEEEVRQPMSLHEQRAAKLAQWQEEIDHARAQERREAEMRAQLLGAAKEQEETMDLGPSLKKRKLEEEDKKTSLIANISAHETPPHEFSKKLEIKTFEGAIIFPSETNKGPTWSPPAGALNPNDEALVFDLEGFDMAKATSGTGNNTIAIKCNAPQDSKRFSINIANPDNQEFDSVLFHFNPRQFEKGGQLVLNNKQEGMWGQAVNVPLSRIPKIFGEQSSTVIFQIHDEGFDVFIEDQHCARLEHRDEVKSGSKLLLQFPATDDRGKPESWSVYKVWWGKKKIMAKDDLTDVYGVNAYIGMHPKKLFVKGLPMVTTDAEVELRRAQLERAFRKYGGDGGVMVTVPTNATFAFIECDSEQQASLALEEMADEYDIKRARRKRHEALQEERAAAAREGKESTDWD